MINELEKRWSNIWLTVTMNDGLLIHNQTRNGATVPMRMT